MLLLLRKSFLLLFFTLIFCCGIYPLVLWTIGQTFFPFQANGSILLDASNKPIGSLLIAQPFTHDEYFHPRPSAVNYNAAASGASNLAASNVQLRDRVANTIASLAKYSHEVVPGDLVTTSASGLDPHITMQNALFQLNRVSTKWATTLKRDPVALRQEILQLLNEKSFSPLLGLAGEEMVNVLEINLALRERYGK
jgi:K+-transporting ATPase KdpC subunit